MRGGDTVVVIEVQVIAWVLLIERHCVVQRRCSVLLARPTSNVILCWTRSCREYNDVMTTVLAVLGVTPHVAVPAAGAEAAGAAGAGGIEAAGAALVAPPLPPPRPRPRGAKPPPRPPRAGPVGGP